MRNYISKKRKKVLEVLDMVREGKSLYAGCETVQISTKEFYDEVAKDEKIKEMYLCAINDYADKCVDDIRVIVQELKNGEIDNSTAKLLIETMKWLVQKASNDVNGFGAENSGDEIDEVREIVVKFV